MPARRASAFFADFAISRRQLLAAILAISSVNGLASRAIFSVALLGWSDAIADTFDISVIVWGAWASACYLAFQQEGGERASKLDIVLAGLATPLLHFRFHGLVGSPSAPFSFYVFWTSQPHTLAPAKRRNILRHLRTHALGANAF